MIIFINTITYRINITIEFSEPVVSIKSLVDRIISWMNQLNEEKL